MNRKEKPLIWLHGEIKNSAAVKRSQDRNRLFAAQTTNGGVALASSFTTDAIDWFEMPRTPYR
jgi:hypothetical protein